MNRPQFTVETIEGTNYDANHLRYSWNVTAGWIISFICSGGELEFNIDRIKNVRFKKEGATWCNECDGSLPEYRKSGEVK